MTECESGTRLGTDTTHDVTYHMDPISHPGRDGPGALHSILLNSHNNLVKLELSTFDSCRSRLTENDLPKVTWQVKGKARN